MEEVQYEGCLMTDAKWQALFNSISEERVVLVIGDGFINVGDIPLDDYIKIQILKRAQAKLKIKNFKKLEKQCENARSLAEILELCGEYLTDGEGQKDIQGQIKKIIQGIDDGLYDASMLKDLLKIGRFNVILSTSISNKFRHIVAEYAYETHQVFIYSELANRSFNSIADWKNATNQVLFINLMGQNFAGHGNTLANLLTSEEDMIHFVHSWVCAISETKKDQSLFSDYLNKGFLLMLGCNVPTWAFRFIWYLIKNPLSKHEKIRSQTQEKKDKLALCTSPKIDNNEQVFAQCLNTEIIKVDETLRFIEDIKDLWPQNEIFKEKMFPDLPGKFRDVFISYASEDRKTVEEDIIPLLEEIRMDQRISFWYDQYNLPAAQRWDKNIEEGVITARIFLTLQTSNSKTIADDSSSDRFLKKEWEMAKDCQEAMNMELEKSGNSFSYILPVIVDEKYFAETFSSMNIQHVRLDDKERLKQSIISLLKTNRAFDQQKEELNNKSKQVSCQQTTIHT